LFGFDQEQQLMIDMARVRRLSLRDALLIGLPAIVLVGVAFWAASRFVQPAPPKRIVISTGAEGGAYHQWAMRYAEILKRDGVTLVVRTSNGSVENLQRLSDATGDVELAFVQGGTRDGVRAAADGPRLVKLAEVAYEPLWLFVRAGSVVDRLTQLGNVRIAAGPEGSGTRQLVSTLLAANGIDSRAQAPLGGQAAADALVKGQVAAAFFVGAAQTPVVQSLLARREVQLAHMATADAYVRRFPFLSKVTLPQSAISFVNDVPPRDITLLSPTALLVAREEAHPALVFLVLQAAREVHAEPGLFQRAGEFPALHPGDFKLSEDAERYFKQGAPLLQRVFPFWLANLVDRLWVLLLPLLAVVLPLFKLVPPLYEWRVKSKFFRRYGELRYIETEVERNPGREALERMLARLAALDEEIRQVSVPTSYSEMLYTFRWHLERVRSSIGARLDGARSGSTGTPP
jgi:TRAP transporter TAXI family solute receptor